MCLTRSKSAMALVVQIPSILKNRVYQTFSNICAPGNAIATTSNWYEIGLKLLNSVHKMPNQSVNADAWKRGVELKCTTSSRYLVLYSKAAKGAGYLKR